ncbi:uncharacterized protein G2W53_011902 [Senna tora]|uniref:Uncharacterized protein n=1 Tax=Senna tora TaxID=362788 RepID=A0A834TX52_9FABA|nr:uncharacterized protein G2W53_011902 [Senna tora]
MKQEIENVKRYFDDLKAYNLKLKARKEELRVGHNGRMQMTIQRVDADGSVKASEIQDPAQLHHLIANQINESLPSNVVNYLGIPDLNVSLDESNPPDSAQPFDISMANKHLCRVMAAQARQKRIQLNRVKNSMGINKPRHSNR